MEAITPAVLPALSRLVVAYRGKPFDRRARRHARLLVELDDAEWNELLTICHAVRTVLSADAYGALNHNPLGPFGLRLRCDGRTLLVTPVSIPSTVVDSLRLNEILVKMYEVNGMLVDVSEESTDLLLKIVGLADW